MNVMYTYDNNYVEIAAVSIKSLLNTNKENIHFFLIQDKVSIENQQRIERMIKNDNAKVTFFEKPNISSILGDDLRIYRWCDSAYSRLFLREIFGSDPLIDKVLYIDCDTLIVGTLKELYDTNLENYLGAACFECMSNMHKYIIGANKNDNYINNGMLLLDVKKWINNDIQEVVTRFVREHNGKIEYIDQGVVNGTISNSFKIVSPKYNLTSLAYDFSYKEMQIYRKPSFGYSEAEWEEAKRNPKIIHFTTSFLSIRPWYEGSNHPYAKKWKEIHDMTPWRENGYRNLNNRKIRNRIETIYRSLPKFLSVRCAGVLHAYVKPILFILRWH